MIHTYHPYSAITELQELVSCVPSFAWFNTTLTLMPRRPCGKKKSFLQLLLFMQSDMMWASVSMRKNKRFDMSHCFGLPYPMAQPPGKCVPLTVHQRLEDNPHLPGNNMGFMLAGLGVLMRALSP